jgi:hypothetical protein
MVVGGLGLLVTLLIWAPRDRAATSRERVVHEDVRDLP